MARAFTYRFNQYSIFDIMAYIKNLGFNIHVWKSDDIDERYIQWEKEQGLQPRNRKHPLHTINVQGLDIYIHLPDLKYFEKHGQLLALPNVVFFNYPKTSAYEESEKLFLKLKRKFGLSRNAQSPKTIKDYEKIKEFVAAHQSPKKFWQFWK